MSGEKKPARYTSTHRADTASASRRRKWLRSAIPVVLVDTEESLRVAGVPRSDSRGAHLIVLSPDEGAFRECVEDCPVVEELLRVTGLLPWEPDTHQQVA